MRTTTPAQHGLASLIAIRRLLSQAIDLCNEIKASDPSLRTCQDTDTMMDHMTGALHAAAHNEDEYLVIVAKEKRTTRAKRAA